MQPRIALYRDRIAIVGANDSGKSELGVHLFETARCPRLFVDPKHSWALAGVKPVYEVEAIDWRAPLNHVRPPWLDRDFSDRLYRRAFRELRHALILTDESYGVSSADWHGSGVDAVQTQGRELEIGHIALIQRPVNVARTLYTEAAHIFVFGLIDEDDLKTLRRGFPWLPLEQLRELVYELPRYGYVWVDLKARRVAVAGPLPDEYRRFKLVSRRRAR